MCFAKNKPDLAPLYDEEDGTVNQDNSSNTTFIPENIHEHVDNVFMNFEVHSEDGILAFIYEAGNEVFIVWTSEEAVKLAYEPFSPLAEYSKFELF